MSNELIPEFAEPISVARTGAGSWVNGAFVPGSPTTLSLTAAVMPLDGDEIQALDLGERVTGAVKIYCETRLYTASEPSKTAADVVTWQGDQYQVAKAAYRAQIHGLEHWDVLAIRREGT